MESMATFFYKQHYQQKISPNLTKDKKLEIAKRISELTLESPIWMDRNKDYSKDFPELIPYITKVIKLSGLYLVSIMESIVEEMQRGNKL